ncbi:hypothetical protein ACQKNB_02195 [Lysinibacillus xylanilyticus]|uniref:hypothetical protein n=1 Tax=Lysinibacillus xylanilyticus TaxID=582475 RepID=UPI003D0048C4
MIGAKVGRLLGDQRHGCFLRESEATATMFFLCESEATATMFFLCESEATATKRPTGTEINPSLL